MIYVIATTPMKPPAPETTPSRVGDARKAADHNAAWTVAGHSCLVVLCHNGDWLNKSRLASHGGPASDFIPSGFVLSYACDGAGACKLVVDRLSQVSPDTVDRSPSYPVYALHYPIFSQINVADHHGRGIPTSGWKCRFPAHSYSATSR